MGKKTSKHAASPPLSPSPLKPLHISSPSVSYDKRSCNSEYDNLLARSRLGGIRPLPVPNNSKLEDMEGGVPTADADWQVLWTLDGLLCMDTHHVLELVQLKRVNLGVRWRDTREAEIPPPSCMMGPHWHWMLATWCVFCCLAALVNILTSEKANAVELGAGLFLSTSCLACYALVGCSNPGIVRRMEVPVDDTYTYCDHCDSYRPEGALHCMDCRVCIEEYDHHCPWTGKCVGKGNARYFYAWLVFLVLAFVYEVIEFTTYLLPPEGQNLLDSSDDSLEIIFPAVTPTPRL